MRDVHNEIRLQSNTNSTPDRWRDEVEHSGIYPASSMGQAPNDAQAQGEASSGQGDRGAEGYNDHGDSEIHPDRLKNQQ